MDAWTSGQAGGAGLKNYVHLFSCAIKLLDDYM